MAPIKPARVILVGMMGSGKTTVGRLLSETTGWPYLDNDELLAERGGRSARQLAAENEEGLRNAESAALQAGLAAPEPCIVGAAAGTILDAVNRAALARGATVVWLRARPETLAQRGTGASHRPWLDGDAVAWLSRAASARESLYASVADITVDVDDLTPAQVVAAIIGQPAVNTVRS